jgi:hypothetical protein
MGIILRLSFFCILIVLLAVCAILPVFYAGKYLSGTPWVFVTVILSVIFWWPALVAFFVYFSKKYLLD